MTQIEKKLRKRKLISIIKRLLALGLFIGANYYYWVHKAELTQPRSPASEEELELLEATNSCPQGWEMKTKVVSVSLEKCLSKYKNHHIYRQTSRKDDKGTLWQGHCTHGFKRVIPGRGELVWGGTPTKRVYNAAEIDGTIEFIASGDFYRIQFESNKDVGHDLKRLPKDNEVRDWFRKARLPKQVELSYCSCKLGPQVCSDLMNGLTTLEEVLGEGEEDHASTGDYTDSAT